MTSWMECGCGGDVTLYEHPGEERYGRRWMLLTGKCRQCGRYYETVPMADLKEYRRLMEEDEIRQYREQKEKEEREYREHLESLTPEELLQEIGPDRYPWFYVVFEDLPVPEGGKRTYDMIGRTSHALTLEHAYTIATLYLRPTQHCRIEQHHKVIDEWTYGDRPFERFTVSVHHDYVVHDTGEVKESESCGIRELTLDEARTKAEKEARSWLDRSATYFSYWIKDKDGNVVEEHHYAKAVEA